MLSPVIMGYIVKKVRTLYSPCTLPTGQSRIVRAQLAAFAEDPQAQRVYVASAEDMILTRLAW